MDSYQVWVWEPVNNQTGVTFSCVYLLVSHPQCHTENGEQLAHISLQAWNAVSFHACLLYSAYAGRLVRVFLNGCHIKGVCVCVVGTGQEMTFTAQLENLFSQS